MFFSNGVFAGSAMVTLSFGRGLRYNEKAMALGAD